MALLVNGEHKQGISEAYDEACGRSPEESILLAQLIITIKLSLRRTLIRSVILFSNRSGYIYLTITVFWRKACLRRIFMCCASLLKTARKNIRKQLK